MTSVIACVCVFQFFSLGEGQLPPMGKWVQADCPARIDISGGWSDTPPITYEHGGAVTMVGVLIEGKVSKDVSQQTDCCCWLVAERPSNMLVYLRDGSAQCCHTEIEIADQTFYLTHSQCTDTMSTSPTVDPILPGAWQGSQWSANFEVRGMT